MVTQQQTVVLAAEEIMVVMLVVLEILEVLVTAVMVAQEKLEQVVLYG